MANIRIATPSRVKMDTAGKNFLDSYQAGLAGFQALSQSAEKHDSDMESAEQDRATALAENDRRNRELRLKEREEKRQSMLFDAGVSTAAAQVTGWDDNGAPPSWLSSGTRALWDQAQGLYETIADKRERGEDVTADVLAFKGIVDQYEQQVPGDRRRQAFSSKSASLTELYEKANEAPNPEIMGLISQGLEAGKFNMGFDPTVEDLAKLGAEHSRLTKRVAEIGQIGQVAVQLGAQREFFQSLLAGTLTDENGQPIEGLPQGEEFLNAIKEGGLFFELKQILDEDYDPWDPENSLQDSTRRLGLIRGKLGIMRDGADSIRDYDYKGLMLRRTQEEVRMFKDRQQVASAYLAEAMERAAAGLPLSPEHEFALMHMDASAQDRGIQYDITYDDDEAYGSSWSLIKERRAAHPGGLPGAAEDWVRGADLRAPFQALSPGEVGYRGRKQFNDGEYWKSFADDVKGWVIQGVEPRYASGMDKIDRFINLGWTVDPEHVQTYGEVALRPTSGREITGDELALYQAIKDAGYSVDEFFGYGEYFDPNTLNRVQQAIVGGVNLLGNMQFGEASGGHGDLTALAEDMATNMGTQRVTHYGSLLEVALDDPEKFSKVMRALRYGDYKPPRGRAESEQEELSEAEQRRMDQEGFDFQPPGTVPTDGLGDAVPSDAPRVDMLAEAEAERRAGTMDAMRPAMDSEQEMLDRDLAANPSPDMMLEDVYQGGQAPLSADDPTGRRQKGATRALGAEDAAQGLPDGDRMVFPVDEPAPGVMQDEVDALVQEVTADETGFEPLDMVSDLIDDERVNLRIENEDTLMGPARKRVKSLRRRDAEDALRKLLDQRKQSPGGKLNRRDAMMVAALVERVIKLRKIDPGGRRRR